MPKEEKIEVFPNAGWVSGILLRDLFAGLVLLGLSVKCELIVRDSDGLAEECYQRADAMLRQRQKKESE